MWGAKRLLPIDFHSIHCFRQQESWASPVFLASPDPSSAASSKLKGLAAALRSHCLGVDLFNGLQCGYGSIPINTIFNGMNIHLPAILMWTTGVQGFDTLPCITYLFLVGNEGMIPTITINNHPSNPQQPIHCLRLAPIRWEWVRNLSLPIHSPTVLTCFDP